MPRPRKGPRIYRRPGRSGWYAYLDREHKDISLETQDEGEATSRLAELLKAHRIRATTKADRPIAESFAELLIRSKTNHTRKTTYEIGLNARRVLAWLEGRQTEYTRDLSRDLVEDYKESRRFGKVSAARINRELDTWKGAVKIAVEMGLCSKATMETAFVRIREPRPQPHQVGLTKKEIKAFLAAEPDPGYRALFRTVVGTGMRDDEMRHMDETDIQPPWIVVTPKPGWTTKGYRARSIPASPATVRAAKTFTAAKAEMSLDPKFIWKRIQRARKAAGIKKHFSMHDLRRAWASHMLAAGHRIEDISRWLGHAELMTTMRYLRVVTTAVPKPSTLPF